MNVTVISETRFAAASADGGLEVTRKIWQDMRQFPGYVDHEIVRDLDDPGHVLVISHWSSREAVETIKNRYGHHPNVVLAQNLATEPRRHWIGSRVEDSSTAGKEAA
ncbi:MAG TPA: antibiotic biosynthesis monooxygenase family protein [Terriglobales bacterium]|nr:antibiotic biosynthesis monooxygenase family protein [Terriglobales bacterium]